jgi:pyruvate dehydrogenase E2 component (dihydrolipoamide acetyltransferase)
MPIPIIMPKFGQMTEESAIVEWLKKEGDPVAKGDILFTVETDKAVMEVESFEAGTLAKIAVAPGVTVPVQSVVGYLSRPGEDTAGAPAPAPAAPAVAKPAPPPSPAQTGPTLTTQTSPLTTVSPPPALFRISPRAAALAERSGIDPSAIKGSGPLGRVVERDVRQFLESRGTSAAAKAELARAPAQQELRPTAEQTAGKPTPSTPSMLRPAAAQTAGKPIPMSRMRQIIAQRLTQSFRDTPHFYVTVSADMTGLAAYRQELKAAGAPYSLTDFISQSVVLSLLEFPTVNSSTDGKTTIAHGQVNLGLAVSIEGGLVVPVIPNAGALTLLDISAASKRLADKARAGKLTPDEMTGGTFTISNMGMLNVENFFAIINPGEGGILAVASVLPQPVVRGDGIAIRQMMKMTLSVDHRLVDGALGALFINAIKAKLEDMALWKRLTA